MYEVPFETDGFYKSSQGFSFPFLKCMDNILTDTLKNSHCMHLVMLDWMFLSVEFSALREECANLRRRIQDIETEMKTSRRENHQLQTDYSKLQDSYKVNYLFNNSIV